jgi:hypothetical protein
MVHSVIFIINNSDATIGGGGGRVVTLLALKSKIITNTTKLHSPVSTNTFFIMSDNDCYEYDDDVDEDMEDNIEYTDEQEVTDEADDADGALENAYYNSKGLREDSIEDAVQAFEEVITSEKQENDNKYSPWSFKRMKQQTTRQSIPTAQ